jgi:hypothetical protein
MDRQSRFSASQQIVPLPGIVVSRQIVQRETLVLDRYEPGDRPPRWMKRSQRAITPIERVRSAARRVEDPSFQARGLYLVSASLAGALIYLMASWPGPRSAVVPASTPLPQLAITAPLPTQAAAPSQASASAAGSLIAESARAVEAASRNPLRAQAAPHPAASISQSAPASAPASLSASAPTRTASLARSPAPVAAAPRQSATAVITSGQSSTELDRPGQSPSPSGASTNHITTGRPTTTPASTPGPAANHIAVPATVPPH